MNPTDPLGLSLDALQHRLDQLQSELDQTRQLGVLGVMVSMIAHEVNNLMTPVLSYAQLALAKPEDRELTVKALERARAGAQHASQIATSILALSRDAAGVGSITGATDLKAAIVEAVEVAAESGVAEIPVNIEVANEIAVRARPVVVHQVVLNLVLNAYRAMRRTGGAISIRAARLEPTVGDTSLPTDCSTWNTTLGPVPNAWAQIDVADNGPGIPSEIAGRLFSPFVRGGTSQGVPGTGLGLAICKTLVESVGGKIRAMPQMPTGTTFTILLPAA